MIVPVPKHYWKFNESSGTIAKDSAGSADVTLDNGSAWGAPWGTPGVQFAPNVASDSVRVATTGLPDLPPPWTIALSVQIWLGSPSATLCSSNQYAIKLQQWFRPAHEVGITTFGQADWSFDVAIPGSTVTYLTVVATTHETKLYLNGVPQGTLPTSIPLGLHWIGSTQGYEEFASGVFSELKVFDQALTDDQVEGLARGYTPPLPPPPPPPPNTASSLLQNAGFEDGTLDGQGLQTVSAGLPNITHWTVTRGGVDYYGAEGWKAVEGARSVDLNGLAPGGVQQAFATVPGTVYDVEFWLAGNPDGAPSVKTMRVEVTPSAPPQGQDFTFDASNASHDNMGWAKQSWQFTAQATTTTIEFYSRTDGDYGPVLDCVVVKQAPGGGAGPVTGGPGHT